MTYREIFSEIYRKNKIYIFFCITLCLVSSILFFGDMHHAEAVDSETIGIVGSMGGSFGKTIAPVIATGFFEGIDTSWVMVIMSASSLGATAGRDAGIMGMDRLSGFSFGIFENTYICIFLLVWFGIPIILKAFSKTNALGVTIETSQKKINGVLMIIIVISQLIANTETKAVLRAAGLGGTGIRKGISALVIFVVVIVTLIIYVLIRYLFALIDIIMVPVSTLVPFVSFFYCFAKLAFIWVMLLFAVYMPGYFLLLAAILLIVAAFLFRTAYMAVRYFENVYVKALFKKIFGGYDQNIPLFAKKVPAKVQEYLQGRNVQMVIPVYVLGVIPGMKGMRKWDRFWMISEQGATYMVRPAFGRKELVNVPLYNTPGQKMFINKFLPYYEIFNIYGSEDIIVKKIKKLPKMCHIVFSKEYTPRYDEIRRLTDFVDYANYREYLKGMNLQPGMPPVR